MTRKVLLKYQQKELWKLLNAERRTFRQQRSRVERPGSFRSLANERFKAGQRQIVLDLLAARNAKAAAERKNRAAQRKRRRTLRLKVTAVGKRK